MPLPLRTVVLKLLLDCWSVASQTGETCLERRHWEESIGMICVWITEGVHSSKYHSWTQLEAVLFLNTGHRPSYIARCWISLLSNFIKILQNLQSYQCLQYDSNSKIIMLLKEQFRSSKPLSKNGDPTNATESCHPKPICTIKSGPCL